MLCWDRLTPGARQALLSAHGESDLLGHGHEGGEHVLLGLLTRADGHAARLLADRGLDLDGARAGLRRIAAQTARPDGAAALRAMGIDLARVRRELEAGFGRAAVREANWKVAHRPWWRGGGRAIPPWRKPVLYKRALAVAAELTRRRGETLVTPEHLLYGVLVDARDPLGTGIARRSRATTFAWTGLRPGGPHPIRLLLDAHGIELDGLIGSI